MTGVPGWSERFATISRRTRRLEHGELVASETASALAEAGAALLVYAVADGLRLQLTGLAPELRERAEARLGPLEERTLAALPAALRGLPGEACLLTEPPPELFAECLGATGGADLAPPGAALSFSPDEAAGQAFLFVLFAPGLTARDLPAAELFFAHVAAALASGRDQREFEALHRLADAVGSLDAAHVEAEATGMLLRAAALDAVCLVPPGRERRLTIAGALTQGEAARLVAAVEAASVAEGRELVELLPGSAPPPVRQLLGALGLALVAVTELGPRPHASGRVLLCRREARPFLPSERSRLQALCGSLGATLDAVRLHGEGRTQANDFKHLFELGRAVAGEQELPRVFKLAARVSAGMVRASDVFVFTPVGKAPDPSLAGRTCLHVDTTDTPPAEDPDGPAMVAGARALALAALRQRVAGTSVELLGADAAGGLLAAAPIFAGDRPVGCLVARRDAADARPFDRPDVQRLRAVADYLAVAMQSAALFAEQHRRMRELVLLNEVASDCAELGLDRLLPAVTQRIARALGLDLVALLFLDPAREELVTGAVANAAGPVTGPRGRAHVSSGLCLRALTSRHHRRGTLDELGLPELQAVARERGLGFAAAVPLLVKDRAIGVVVTLRAGQPVAEEEALQLTAICSEIAVAVENGRLFGEAERRASDLELMQSVGEAIARTLDSRAVLREAMERLCEVLECDVARAYVRRDTMFVCVSELGVPPRLAAVGARMAGDSPEMSLALHAPTPQDLPLGELPEPSRAFCAALGVQRLAAVPLRIREHGAGAVQHLGTVLLGRKAPRSFAPAELGLLAAVATQLAVALKNAQLHEETRQRVEDLSVVSEAGRALLEERPLQEVLDGVAQRLAQLVSARGCLILLWDEKAQRLGEAGVSETVPARFKELRFTLDEAGELARAVTEKSPVQERRHPDAPWARRFDDALGWRAASVFALPLLSGDRVIGVIILMDDAPGRHLSDEEINRAMAIGHQVAIAVERARLHVQLAKSYAELDRAQAQLVRRERLAALGELAALVAHEVRNPLGVIFNSLGSLKKLVDLQGDAQRLYEIIREEAVQLNGIVGDLLDFARPTVPQLAYGPLDRLVREAVESAATSERGRGTPVDTVETVLALDPSLPPVPMDERMMRQAVVNLLSNAYQSAPRGGHVAVRTELARDGGGRTVARVTVRDDGSGIPDEARARLFEPFFTTKATGSGLGLAMVKRIMDGHRGDVSVRTAPGEGTTFVLDLPLDGAEPVRG